MPCLMLSFSITLIPISIFDFFDTDNRTDLSVDASVAGAIIGGVIGGVFLIAVGSAIVCWCVSRREPSQGGVLYTTQGYPSKYKNATRKKKCCMHLLQFVKFRV